MAVHTATTMYSPSHQVAYIWRTGRQSLSPLVYASLADSSSSVRHTAHYVHALSLSECVCIYTHVYTHYWPLFIYIFWVE